MNKTSISWVLGPDGAPGFSWNPVIGCAAKKVSPGCAHCYAERLAATRLAHLPAYAGLAKMVHRATGVGGGFEDVPRWTGEVRFFPERLAEPLRRRKPAGIFVGDMGDIALLPFEQIAAIFGVMAACPQHRFFILSKRPERLREFWEMVMGAGGLGKYIRANWKMLREFFQNDACCRFGTYRGRPMRTSQDAGCQVLNAAGIQSLAWPSHVWVGASASTQKDLDRVVPELLRIPAAVRFLSLEPLLECIDLTAPVCADGDGLGKALFNYGENAGIDWVITGGESGPNARPCHVDWIRSIVCQCAEAGVPCWVKQLGARACKQTPLTKPMGIVEWMGLRDRAGADPSEWAEDLRVRQMPEVES